MKRRLPLVMLVLAGAAVAAGAGLGPGRSAQVAGSAATSVLDPGQSTGFAATYARGAHARVAVQAQVQLPGVARRFRLRVGTSHQPFAPCRGAVGLGNL